MNPHWSAHRHSVDTRLRFDTSLRFEALRNATALPGLNLQKSSLQMGFPGKDEERKRSDRTLCCFEAPWSGVEGNSSVSPLLLWLVPSQPSAGPRPDGTENRGELPGPEPQGAMELGGRQVGVRAVVAERTLLTLDYIHFLFFFVIARFFFSFRQVLWMI